MRSMKLVAVGAISLISFAGCLQGQPRIYRVAVDETPVRTISVPSCFRNNNLPTGRGNFSEQFYRSEDEWVIWNGVDQTEYLDLGKQQWKLGDAPTIDVTDLIEGTDKTFSALRNVSASHLADPGVFDFAGIDARRRPPGDEESAAEPWQEP